MQEFIRHEDVVLYDELLAWNLQGEHSVEYVLFYVEVTDPSRYRRAIADVDSIQWYRISLIDENSLYVFVCQETREEDLMFRRAFWDLELIVVPPIIYDEDAAMQITVIGQGEDLKTLIEEMPGSIEVTIEGVGQYDRRYARIAGALTDRQFEALKVAVEHGYYEVPRQTSLATVAAELDCAESTASAHLRKAEATIMSQIVNH